MVAPPVGYERPAFPSLFWPLGRMNSSYEVSFLYTFKDIWMFSTAWTIILMTGLYSACALLYLFTHSVGVYRHPSYKFDNNSYNGNNGNNNLNHTSDNDNENIEFHGMNYNHLYKSTMSTYQHYFVNVFFTGSLKIRIAIFCVYVVVGAFQGLFIGSIVGVLISAIYTAAQFKITTWIPFVYAIISVLFNLSSAYSFTVKTM